MTCGITCYFFILLDWFGAFVNRRNKCLSVGNSTTPTVHIRELRSYSRELGWITASPCRLATAFSHSWVCVGTFRSSAALTCEEVFAIGAGSSYCAERTADALLLVFQTTGMNAPLSSSTILSFGRIAPTKRRKTRCLECILYLNNCNDEVE